MIAAHIGQGLQDWVQEPFNAWGQREWGERVNGDLHPSTVAGLLENKCWYKYAILPEVDR